MEVPIGNVRGQQRSQSTDDVETNHSDFNSRGRTEDDDIRYALANGTLTITALQAVAAGTLSVEQLNQIAAGDIDRELAISILTRG